MPDTVDNEGRWNSQLLGRLANLGRVMLDCARELANRIDFNCACHALNPSDSQKMVLPDLGNPHSTKTKKRMSQCSHRVVRRLASFSRSWMDRSVFSFADPHSGHLGRLT
jgi:hypothetical protein